MLPIIIIILCIVLFVLWFKSKNIRTDSILLVNGPVGSGKSSTSLYIARFKYAVKKVRYYLKKYVFIWLILCLKLIFLFHKKDNINATKETFKTLEKPLFYSNVPLYKMEYVPINTDILKRVKYRFAYNSILYLNEATLIANSQNYKDKEINEGLTMFVKLVRHEMRGSGLCMVIDTQSPQDLHYSADRSINQALWIQKSMNLPFFRLLWIREIAINQQNTTNVYFDDVKEDSSLRWYLVPKSIFKHYDSHAWSVLTDDLDVLDDIHYIKKKKKKRFFIATWLDYKELLRNNEIYLKEVEKDEQESTQ